MSGPTVTSVPSKQVHRVVTANPTCHVVLIGVTATKLFVSVKRRRDHAEGEVRGHGLLDGGHELIE